METRTELGKLANLQAQHKIRMNDNKKC